MYDLYFLHHNTIDKIEKKQIEEKKEKKPDYISQTRALDVHCCFDYIIPSKQWYMNTEQCFLSRLCRKHCPIVPLQM